MEEDLNIYNIEKIKNIIDITYNNNTKKYKIFNIIRHTKDDVIKKRLNFASMDAKAIKKITISIGKILKYIRNEYLLSDYKIIHLILYKYKNQITLGYTTSLNKKISEKAEFKILKFYDIYEKTNLYIDLINEFIKQSKKENIGYGEEDINLENMLDNLKNNSTFYDESSNYLLELN